MWILLVTVPFWLIQTVHCGGFVEVQLISYNYTVNGNHSNLCCDVIGDSSCDGCDPYIEISLANHSSLGVNVSNTGVTMKYNNTNFVDFGTSTNISMRTFNLTFNTLQYSYYLVFRVFDQNTSVPVVSPPSKIDEVTFHVGQGESSSFTSHPNYTIKALTGIYADLRFGYFIQCDMFYYGVKCVDYCRPVSGQYTCDKYGHRVCDPGWSGKNCTVHTVGSSCSNTACEHGATCVQTHSNTTLCNCTSEYTGPFCEVQISTNPPTTPGSSTNTANSSSPPAGTVPTTVTTNALTSTAGPNPSTAMTGSVLPTLAAVTLTLNQSTLGLDTSEPGTNTYLTGIIVGAIAGTILLALIVTAILVIICKKKKRKVEDSEVSH